jgi:hypothetical protein
VVITYYPVGHATRRLELQASLGISTSLFLARNSHNSHSIVNALKPTQPNRIPFAGSHVPGAGPLPWPCCWPPWDGTDGVAANLMPMFGDHTGAAGGIGVGCCGSKLSAQDCMRASA